jgi:hypothetical protein
MNTVTTPADVALRLAAPPREVPLSLRVSTLFNVVTQIGFFLLAFSSPFFWAFAWNMDHSWLTFRGDIVRTNGTVTDVSDTRTSENRRRIYEIRYTYSVSAVRYDGISWISGDSPEAGAVVTVEYKRPSPQVSRIEGMRRGMFGPGVLLVLIFPGVGLTVTVFAMRWGVRHLRLLERGAVASGKLIRREETNVTVNRQRVWALTFEFTTLEGVRHEATARTHVTDKLTDDAQEILLYEPADPARAIPLDDFSPRPEFDDASRIKGDPARALLSAIMPALTIGGNLWWVWHLLGM